VKTAPLYPQLADEHAITSLPVASYSSRTALSSSATPNPADLN